MWSRRSGRRRRTAALAAAVLAALLACAGQGDPAPAAREEPGAAYERYVAAGRRWEKSGRPDAAILYFQRALAAALRLPKPDLRRAEAHYELGDALRRRLRLPEATGEFEAARAELDAVPGGSALLLARILDAQGYVQLAGGDPETATFTLAHALKVRIEATGLDDVETAETMVNLAEAHRRISDYERAVTLLVEAAAIYSEKGPEYLIRVATIHDTMGQIYRDMERYEEAEKLHLRALQLARRVQAEDNPNVAIFQRSLANLYVHTGHPDEARFLYREALATLEKTLGPDHYETKATRTMLEQAFPDTVGP